MKLTLAIALILAELGVGVLLMLPLIPIGEVKKSFFTFHSMLTAVCFALAAGLHAMELHSTLAAVGLVVATVACASGFGTSHLEKPKVTRFLHWIGAITGIAFGIVVPLCGLGTQLTAAQGSDVITPLLVGSWMISALLGAVLLGCVHDAMGLGHWYLISRNLSFGYLIRITKVLLLVLGLRGICLVVILVAMPHLAQLHSQQYLAQLFSISGDLMFFLMRVMWGLALPIVLAVMSWRCAVGKANQAATGLLYLCEVSVLFGELFAAYLMI